MMALLLERSLFSCEVKAPLVLLHFSPEMGLQRWLKKRLPMFCYKATDLASPDVDLHLDLHKIEIPDGSVDVVILSHVLEHVDDDIVALKELSRILSPSGRLILQVPLSGGDTTQDIKLDDPEARLVAYGKTDHVRLYGYDITERLNEAGFSVEIHRALDHPYYESFEAMALDLPHDSTMLYKNESTTFLCFKSSART
jgi:SAM-dependent methyltransferase